MRAMVLLISQCPNFSPTYNTSYACFCSHRDGRWVCACNRWMHRCASPKKREIIEHSKEIKPVSPKGNQPWTFIRQTDAEAEAPILWPPDVKSQLIGKDPDAGKDWGQEEKETTEGEMVGWHHWLNGHEFEQTSGDDEGWESLVCCSPWGCKELDITGDWTPGRSTAVQELSPHWYYCAVAQSCPTLCEPMECNTPDFPVLHHLCCCCC